MDKPGIVCVVPTCRPDWMKRFMISWDNPFTKHDVTLVVVVDGDEPRIERYHPRLPITVTDCKDVAPSIQECFCRHTDAVRNYGFVYAARHIKFDYLLTLDDDVAPPQWRDPIAEHLSVMGRKVPVSWMNAAMGTTPDDVPYLRGFPYGVREEATVHLSHGVWSGVPDFDARTQLALGNGVPSELDYYRGPVPRGVYLPISGMNVMISRSTLPDFYFAPQGPDSGFPEVNRFADIWMGRLLQEKFWSQKKAVWTGTSVVYHTRASDPHKNSKLEEKGLEMNEGHLSAWTSQYGSEYAAKRTRYRDYVTELLAK